MPQFTDISLSDHALRLYNDDTGLEIIVPRQHIIAIGFNGEEFSYSTSLQTHIPIPVWAPKHSREDDPDCWNMLDRVVTSFYLGGNTHDF